MKLRTTNYWIKNWPIAFHSIDDHEKWINFNLTPRQQAFVAIYMLKQYKFATLDDHAFITQLEQIIENKDTEQLKSIIIVNLSDKYKIRNMLWQQAIHIINAYLETPPILGRSPAYWLFALLNFSLELMNVRGSKNPDDFFEKAARKQNRFLSLFLPIKNWQSSYHTTTTTQLAKTIYQTNNWSMCPILADALMDVGCTDPYILWLLTKQHHLFAKGVWIIDKLAGNPIK